MLIHHFIPRFATLTQPAACNRSPMAFMLGALVLGLFAGSEPAMATASSQTSVVSFTVGQSAPVELAKKKKKKKSKKKKSKKATSKEASKNDAKGSDSAKESQTSDAKASQQKDAPATEGTPKSEPAPASEAQPASDGDANAAKAAAKTTGADADAAAQDASAASTNTSQSAPAAAVLQSTSEAAATMTPADEGAEKLVAVLDFEAAPELKDLAQALTTVATLELSVRNGYKSISRNDLQSILTHQAESQLLGCESVSCMADIAKLVEANLLVTGKLDKANDAVVFSMTLIDPAGPTVLQRTEAVWRSDPKGMIALMNPQLDRLLNGDEANQFTGKVEVLADSGATIFLNNVEKEPIIDGVTIGSHRLIVSKGGHVTHEQDIVVSRNETTIVRVELEPSPIYTQWWFWTLIGGTGVTTATLLTGAAVGTAALLMQEPDTTVTVK